MVHLASPIGHATKHVIGNLEESITYGVGSWWSKFNLILFRNEIILRFYENLIYRLIAMATITFSKRKGAATKRGRILYEGGH